MRRQWGLVGTQRTLEIQKTEHVFEATQSSANSFSLCMMQLWLFAFRHFIHQRRRTKSNRRNFGWSTEDHSLTKLANLADRLGFKSDEITTLLQEDMYQNIAKGLIESLCREDFYIIQESRVQLLSNQMRKFLRNLPRYSEEDLEAAEFTTDDTEKRAKNRYNSPVHDQYEHQRKHLFLDRVLGQDQPAAQYPTSLGVTREILCCFFGHEIQTKTSSQPGRAPETSAFQDTLEPTGDDNMTMDASVAASPSINESLIGQMDATLENRQSAQMDTEEPLPDQSSSRYSRSPNVPTTPVDDPSEPVEIEPYPSGTPDAPPLLAPGFEVPSCNCLMETKNYLSVRRKVPEILKIWFQSQREVIVIFLFESRAYFKFSLVGGVNLRLVLQDLSREHIFIVINEFGIEMPDINKTYEEALKERLLLVSKRDNPAQGKNEVGMISLDKLREYVFKYDIHTGKRKATLNEEPRKRHAGTTKDPSEEI
ncbi:hypothetical protein N7508_007173 [Penicillium antarcticum]|uniref:uncharacterized protein n=1 Tax=Penicillium antarcticum TaxID=416450 RepID=UPI002397B0A1|nr:uncharacterized protein N7508_007173 [Penicillium antarcticum]KAJ5302310.1 hypothetical protein N7508_007173 [Penicillium antarcticum]